MGIFDFLKSKAKTVTDAVQDKPAEQPKVEKKEAIHEEVAVEEVEVEEEEEAEYVPSSKTVQGVSYPHGWEDLSDLEISSKLEEVMKEYNAADGDDDLEDAVFPKYGFEAAGHYEEFKNALIMEKASTEGVSFTQAAVDQAAEKREADVAAAVDSDREDLKPVDGVSIDDWAKANAALLGAGGIDEALKISKKDKAGWDKVNEEWQTRMANDTTFTIAQVYGKAFNASAEGNLGSSDSITAESFPYEKYVEVQVAQDLLCQQGKDAQEVLAMFDMTVADWSNVGAFWSTEFHSNVDKYLPLNEEYTKKFEEKYKAGDSNSDIEF